MLAGQREGLRGMQLSWDQSPPSLSRVGQAAEAAGWEGMGAQARLQACTVVPLLSPAMQAG